MCENIKVGILPVTEDLRIGKVKNGMWQRGYKDIPIGSILLAIIEHFHKNNNLDNHKFGDNEYTYKIKIVKVKTKKSKG